MADVQYRAIEQRIDTSVKVRIVPDYRQLYWLPLALEIEHTHRLWSRIRTNNVFRARSAIDPPERRVRQHTLDIEAVLTKVYTCYDPIHQ
jgi:hypothetical protein